MFRIPASLLILSFFLLSYGTACAQQFRGWNKEQTPEFYIRTFIQTSDTNGLSKALTAINQNRTLLTDGMAQLLRKAEKVAEKEHNAYLANIYSLLITYYLREDDRPKYLEYLLLEYHRLSQTGQMREMMWLLVDIGNLFLIEHDYNQAGDFYKEAEGIARKRKEQHALNVIYLNYGLIAENKKQYPQALEYYRKASRTGHQRGTPDMRAMNYACIAGAYALLAVPDSVMHYAQLAEERYAAMKPEDQEFHEDLPSIINRTYADYHVLLGQNERALEYLQKAKNYALIRQIDYEYQANVYREAAVLYKMKKYSEGIRLLKGMLDFNESKGLFSEQKRTWEQIAEGYTKMNDYRHAAEALDNYRLVSDSLEKVSYNSELNLMRTITKVYQKDMNLSKARRLIDLKELRSRQQDRERNISYAIVGILVILIATLLGFYMKIRSNKQKLEILHDRLLRQNNKIVENAVELERSNEIRDRLFSVIAHDLRNPLNRLLVEFSLLEKALPDRATANATNTLRETISLFESLLLWSKMEDKTTIYSPVKTETAEQIGKIIHFFEPDASAQNITLLSPDQNFIVFADPNILQTMLRNLVSNAINAIGQNGSIIISQQEFEGMVRLTISDTGPGFPDETIRKFYSDEESKSVQANGFGLMLCKVLARISRWAIDISNDEHGAHVRILIPLYRQRAAQETVKSSDQLALPSAWKHKLSPLLAFKHYQTSDIRKFLRSLGMIDDEDTRQWVVHLEIAVHEANAGLFIKLLDMLEETPDQ